MSDFSRRYFEQYCTYQKLDPQKKVQAYVDRELSPKYPVVLKQSAKHLIVGIAPQIADAREPIERELSPDSTLETVIRFLFDDQIGYEADDSLIAALDPQHFVPTGLPEGLTARILGWRDGRALRKLEKTLARTEKLLAQISVRDQLIVGLFEENELVSAASLLKWNDIYDVGVMTHPEKRRRGYGAAAVSELSKIALERGWTVQYRADERNEASVSLMKKLGFDVQLCLHGAMIHVKE